MKRLLGKQIGDRYQLHRLLGKSVGRRTFLATDAAAHRQVVIKLMLFGPDFTWENLKLFERESRTLRQLSHPSIPTYLDSFEVQTQWGEGYALVQTYIPAKSLQALANAGHRWREPQLVAIARSLLHVLNYLHQQSPPVIHRDIKPSNILLRQATASRPSAVYLVDFGAVRTEKLDGTLTIVGTYGYMPPEQFSGNAHPASDLYSLGATLIYLATGQHPAELISDRLEIEFEAVSPLSDTFSHWLRRLTYIDLSKRTPSADVARHELDHPPASIKTTLAKRREPSIAPPFTTDINADIRVYSSFQSLEIQYHRQRTTGMFDAINHYFGTLASNQSYDTVLLNTLGVIYILGLVITTLMLVAGSMPLNVVVLKVLPFWLIAVVFGLYWDIVQSAHPQKKSVMSLILLRNPEGAIFLTLHALESQKRLCLSSPLRMVKLQLPPPPLKSQLHFVLLPHKSHSSRRLSIRGTFSEIQWVYRQLERWGSIPIEGLKD